MEIKFIVVDDSDFPQKPTAKVFGHHLDLLRYLKEYGIKYKRVYRIDKEMTSQFNCSLA
jgi:hypothetical protein